MSYKDFHPDLRLAARFLPRGTAPNHTRMRIMRGLESVPRPSNARAQNLRLDAGMSVRIYRPTAHTGPGPALLWMHGGGYVMGTARQDDRYCRRFADALGLTVVSVNYRLAPEHPYPAALDDCRTAFEFTAGLPEVDTTRIAIGGMSAGAGLAAALAIRLRDQAAITPAYQLLVYPMLDDRTGSAPHPHADRFRLWDQASNIFGWRSYLGDADPAIAVPARHTDLSGLPPTWIGVGTLDLFHDENLDYARRLRAAGVPCEFHAVEGAFHGFDEILPNTTVAREFFTAQHAGLRAALAIDRARRVRSPHGKELRQ